MGNDGNDKLNGKERRRGEDRRKSERRVPDREAKASVLTTRKGDRRGAPRRAADKKKS